MADIKDINIINRVIESYFNNNPSIASIKPKDIMPYLVEAGVYNKDQRAGLPVRDLLRKLDESKQLHLIPTVRPERKKVNTHWHFDRPSPSNTDNTIQNYSASFENWIRENHTQITKPKKYVGAIRTISNDLIAISKISDLFEIVDVSSLQELRALYLDTPELITKNNNL